MRLDKWLWAARFFKTRSLAQQAIAVREWRVHVRVLSERRSDLRRWGAEPARDLKGRPTKRDRRRLDRLTESEDL